MQPEHLSANIQAILERNARVEAEKAWEVSWTRRMIIAGITYITAVIFLSFTDQPLPLLLALVPTGGYLLSTLSLPWAKAMWMKQRKN
jgi:hypothetical protein